MSRSDLLIRPYEVADEPAVIALWHDCGLVRPWNDPTRDIARKLGTQPDRFLVAAREGTIVGTVMAGFDGHRGWMNYLAVMPSRQRAGIGTALVREAERLLLEAGCPKLNLQVRSSNSAVLEFYSTLGYRRDEVVSLGKRLIVDDAD